MRVELRSSRCAEALVPAAAIPLCVLLVCVALPPWLQASAVGLVGAHALLVSRRWARAAAPGSLRALEVSADRQILIEHADGHVSTGTIHHDTFVASWLTCITWRDVDTRRVRSFALLPDMMDADDFRHLRVMLRMGEASSPAPIGTTQIDRGRQASAQHR